MDSDIWGRKGECVAFPPAKDLVLKCCSTSVTKGVSVHPFSHLLAEGVSEEKAFSSESSIVSPAGSQSSGHPHRFYVCPIAYCHTSFLQGRFVPYEIHERVGSTKLPGEGEEAVCIGECCKSSCVCEFFMQPSKPPHKILPFRLRSWEDAQALRSGFYFCSEDRVLGGPCLQGWNEHACTGSSWTSFASPYVTR